jgi:hypothetical protein
LFVLFQERAASVALFYLDIMETFIHLSRTKPKHMKTIYGMPVINRGLIGVSISRLIKLIDEHFETVGDPLKRISMIRALDPCTKILVINILNHEFKIETSLEFIV